MVHFTVTRHQGSCCLAVARRASAACSKRASSSKPRRVPSRRPAKRRRQKTALHSQPSTVFALSCQASDMHIAQTSMPCQPYQITKLKDSEDFGAGASNPRSGIHCKFQAQWLEWESPAYEFKDGQPEAQAAPSSRSFAEATCIPKPESQVLVMSLRPRFSARSCNEQDSRANVSARFHGMLQ